MCVLKYTHIEPYTQRRTHTQTHKGRQRETEGETDRETDRETEKKTQMVDYGQLVIGPPGSGKSTYCEGMHQLMSTLGREHLTINLDFANDWNSRNDYNLSKGNKDVILFDPPDVDVRNLITIDRVMKEKNLGPNGALLYCNSYLAKNMQWLKTKIKDAKHKKQTQHGIYTHF